MKYRIILFVSASILLAGCGKTPIFSEMNSHRLKIVLKGTFESGSASNFLAMGSQSINISPMQDDSVVAVPDSTFSGSVTDAAQMDQLPETFMIDIAEIRVDGKKISNYRQLLSVPLDDSHPFFNGTGVELKTDDPHDGRYNTVQIYIRKMGFDNAKVYKLTGNTFAYEKERQVIFHEDTIDGFDINQLMVNSYWDSLRIESDEIIRVFPMQIPIVGGLEYSQKNGETVLEIRLLIKNYIKKYECGYYEDGVYKIMHYYAFSDWLRDVKKGETDIGRNLHAVASSYIQGKSGSLTVNTSGGYVVAIPSSEADTCLSDYYITDTGKNLRSAVGNSDVPIAPSYPGAYIEPLLDYYLNVEKYRDDWNKSAAQLISDAAALSNSETTVTPLEVYSAAWDTYEKAVHGDPDEVYACGLKIPPYVGYGTSVTFSKMAPGTYKLYRLDRPAYGALFLQSAFTSGYLGEQTIQSGDNKNVTY